MNYTTLQFLKELKKQLSYQINHYISSEYLSVKILNQKKKHIEMILFRTRKDSKYLLTEELLTKWISELRANKHFNSNIKDIFDMYRKCNDLPEGRFKILRYHPNLKINYFKNINNKDKSYWLGWLFAEGYLYHGKDQQLVINVEIGVKDGFLIKRYIEAIGFNPRRVKYQRRIRYNDKGEIYTSRTFTVRFKNKLFAKNLIEKGFIVGKKAAKIRLPTFTRREYYLVFLLGYFDGDGYIKKNSKGKISNLTIKSKSKSFLEDIKSEFKSDLSHYKIVIDKKAKKDGFIEEYYVLTLSGFLFNEMMKNYRDSLPRKRGYFSDSQIERQQNIKSNQPYKFKFSKKQLKQLVKELTFQQIADLHVKKYGIHISRNTVRYHYDRWNIFVKA